VRELVGTPEPGPSNDEQPSAWVPGMRLPARHGAEPPDGWRGLLRWDPGRRGVLALGLAVVVVLAATGWWLAARRPTSMPIAASDGGASALGSASASVAVPSPPDVTPTATSVGTSPTPSAVAGSVVVDVAGKVRRPGIYTLSAGSRIFDAVRAAGGARRGASTTALNLAAPLQDGEQIVVGVAGGVTAATVPAPVGSVGGSGVPGAPVDLNTATLDQLEALPGIGPVLGQNILDWRAAHGTFGTVEQLQDVSGIGPAKFGELKNLVSV
jgi:competence protein ComEA